MTVSVLLGTATVGNTTVADSFSASGLTASTTYTAETEILLGGTAVGTATSSFTTLPTPPTAPSISGLSSTQTTISGTLGAPSSGDSPFTYVVQYAKTGVLTFSSLPAQSSTSFTIPNLSAGQSYTIQAFAIDAVGQAGAVSSQSTESTQTAVTPTTWNPNNKASTITLSNNNLTATAGTGTFGQSPNYDSETVYSSTSRSTGLLYFEVEMSTASNDFTIGFAGSGCSTDLSGGLGGTAGTGGKTCGYYPVSPAQSVWINGTEVLSPTGSPTADSSGAVLKCAVNLNTKKAWFQSPAMVTTYGAGAWNASTSNSPASGTGGIDISGLTFPLVIAFNEMEAGVAILNVGATAFSGTVPSGFSAWDSSGATLAVPGVPGTPTAVSENTSAITFKWTAPTSGGAVASYQPRIATSASGPWTPLPATSMLQATALNLSASTNYYFDVAATNASGSSAFSAASAAISTSAAGTSPPGPVTGFAATSETATSISYGWNSDSGATGYIIQISTDGVNYVEPGSSEGNVTAATISNLHSGTNYWAQIAGTNAGGTGPFTAVASPTQTTAASGVPGQVPNPTLTPLSMSQLRVAWSAPGSGGAPTGYYIKYKRNFDSAFNAPLGPFTSSPHTITGLSESYTYNVQVYAANSSGNGPPSTTVTARTLRDFCRNPGADGSFVLKTFATTAQWLTSGAVIDNLRNGSHGAPTGVVNTPGNFAVPFYQGQSSDPQVEITDGTKSLNIRLPLGAVIEGPTSSTDQSIGGTSEDLPGLAWCCNDASMNTGSVQSSGSVITAGSGAGPGMVLEDSTGQFMTDAVTGVNGAFNAYGAVNDYDLTRLNEDPNYVIGHMLQYLLDGNVQASNGGPIWPLALIDGSFSNGGQVAQGYTIGIPADQVMPSGQTRGFKAWWDVLQQKGAYFYNVAGGNGCAVFMVYPLSQANMALAQDMANSISAIMAHVCILNNQTGPSSLKGLASGGVPAFPDEPNGDMTPFGNVNVSPTTHSWGGWYETDQGTLSYQATPSNALNPT